VLPWIAERRIEHARVLLEARRRSDVRMPGVAWIGDE
jgi:hypothetical protein